MLTIDFTNMMVGALADGQGITEDEWSAAASAFATAHSAVSRMHDAGLLGFIDLPTNRDLLEQSLRVVESRRDQVDNVLLLGIGGSALGPIALRSALRKHGWNALDHDARRGYPCLHVLDNVDPATIDAVRGRLEVSRTRVLVISKSGGTVETMAQYLIVRAALIRELGEERARAQLVFVTDPENGALRRIARQDGVETVDIPANVGGRFSVFSPVGVLPAALIGIDVHALLDGAAHATRQAQDSTLSTNLPGTFATLQWLADTRHGRNIHALMPYADPLRDIASWFVQLWAESLGKRRSDGTLAGPTPIPAVGATDQHSQVQLFMEGPLDKTVSFISVAGREREGLIPSAHADIPELEYIGGHTLGELIGIEQRATAGALAARGRYNLTIQLDTIDEWHVGALLQTFCLATAYAGALYNVNAFDQPGVELGKNFAYAMLGRKGSEAARAEWDKLPAPDPRWRV